MRGADETDMIFKRQYCFVFDSNVYNTASFVPGTTPAMATVVSAAKLSDEHSTDIVEIEVKKLCPMIATQSAAFGDPQFMVIYAVPEAVAIQ
jgi:hypothetical protein